MAERTLVWDVFDYVFESDRRRMGRLPAGQAGIKPVRTYRNPAFLAREWKKMLESGEHTSQTQTGVSRTRVTRPFL